MRLIVTPPDSFSSLADYTDWLELLIVHEYTHVLHLDKSSGLPKGLRNIFGRFLFLFPNLMQPPWVIEGLATYLETDNTKNIGRGQNSYYRMLMRMEVKNGIKPISQVNQPLVSWPMNTSRYLYGVYFFNFVRDAYGEKKVFELIENYSDNLVPFAINGNSRSVFGKSMNQLWEEFNQYLDKEFQPEIEKIKRNALTEPELITHSGYFTSAPQISTNGDVYFLEKNMRDKPHLMVLKNGDKLAQAFAETHAHDFDIHPQSGILVAELNNVRTTNVFSDLLIIDPVTGGKRQITHGKRYLYAAWSPDGQKIVAVHNELGEQALHLLNKNGELEKILWQGTDKTVLGRPDWSPVSDELVISVWRPGSQWNLEIFDINTLSWKKLTHSENIETTPQYSADGKNILYSADYDGVFNIQKLDLLTGKVSTLTNVMGGAFYPATTSDNESLYFINASSNGFDLSRQVTPTIRTAEINDKQSQPVVNETPIEKEAQTVYNVISDYDPIPLILPTGWFPYFYKNEERTDVGILTWGSDPIYRHNYTLNLAYDTENKWLVGRFDYLYDRWNPSLKFSVDKQAVTYLDNNNVVERYRDLDTYTFEAMWPFFTVEQQYIFHAGIVYEQESDKDIQSNFGELPDRKNDLVGIALSYNSTDRLPDSISPNFGRQLRAVAENSDYLKSEHTGQIFTVDWREFIDLPGLHVLGARAVMGYGTDRPEYFRLGGTEETSVSPLPQVAAYATTQRIFGQRRYPLMGYPTGRSDLTGRRMILAHLDWRFPIIRLERGLMAPPIGVHQIHGKVFYNLGEIWNKENDFTSFRRGAGLEFNSELTAGYWIPVNMRLGFARGFDEGGEDQAYLEIRFSI